MSKQRIAAVLVAVVLVLGGGGFWLSRYLQREQWIAQQVYTPSMLEVREHAYLGKLAAETFMREKKKSDGFELFNAIFYPECHTVIVTVDMPEQFEEFAAYLVAEDGKVYPGWYMPELVKFEIAKVAFENLETDRIVALHLVDQSLIAGGTFHPDVPPKGSVSFGLTPPVHKSTPEQSSEQEAK